MSISVNILLFDGRDEMLKLVFISCVNEYIECDEYMLRIFFVEYLFLLMIFKVYIYEYDIIYCYLYVILWKNFMLIIKLKVVCECCVLWVYYIFFSIIFIFVSEGNGK